MFKIEKIFRYPVKSMGGDDMQTTFLSENGIPGDRCWTLKDEVRGGIKGGKRFPHLWVCIQGSRQNPQEKESLLM